MQTNEYLDKDGWRYVWVNGVLQTAGVPSDRIKKLAGSEPLAVSLHRFAQQSRK